MIWYDVADQVWSESAGSTSDPIHRVEGYASALNGRRVDWRLETADGETATFILDGQQYDPSGGVLFLVSTKDGETQVRQLSRDLSTVQPTNQSCEAFAEADADVSRFTRSSEPPR
jgi:hypothetical protein